MNRIRNAEYALSIALIIGAVIGALYISGELSRLSPILPALAHLRSALTLATN